MLLLSVCWVLLLLGVLSWVTPDARYPRGREAGVFYYSVWSLLLSLLVYLHYQMMAHAGYGELAVFLDVCAVGAFSALRLLGIWLKQFRSHAVYQFELQSMRQQREDFETTGTIKHRD